jgi:hypothetical protein
MKQRDRGKPLKLWKEQLAQILIVVLIWQITLLPLAMANNGGSREVKEKEVISLKDLKVIVQEIGGLISKLKVSDGKKVNDNGANNKYSNNSIKNKLAQISPKVAIVRHAPGLNGGQIEGTVQMLMGEALNINSGVTISGDLLVPGSPQVTINGIVGSNIQYQGTVSGGGSGLPSKYSVTINGGVNLRQIVTHSDPVAIALVAAALASMGSRDVVISGSSDTATVGDFNTIRSLTLQSDYTGILAVAPGKYSRLVANNGGFQLGSDGEVG